MKTVKKFIAICISFIMAVSVAVMSVSANEAARIDELDKVKIIHQMEAAGFRLMTDAEVAEMYSCASNTMRMKNNTLPYTGSIYYTGSSSKAYSPIFDVSGQMSDTTQIKLSWKPYDGNKRLRTELQLYVENIGWFDETAKNINSYSAVLSTNTTVLENVSQFAVKFERYQKNIYGEDTDECSTNFKYTISLN